MKKNTKYFVAFGIIALAIIPSLLDPNKPSVESLVILLPFALVFATLVIGQGEPWLKPILTSKWNFLSASYSDQINIELEFDLAFEKTIEVIEHAGFVITHNDKSKRQIIATNGISFWSWGESIYFDFESNEESTKISFVSINPQVTTWGQNRRNITRFAQNFEKSMTI